MTKRADPVSDLDPERLPYSRSRSDMGQKFRIQATTQEWKIKKQNNKKTEKRMLPNLYIFSHKSAPDKVTAPLPPIAQYMSILRVNVLIRAL